MKRNLGQISVGSISLISSGALVIPITLPITATLANRGGAASDGVLVGSLTPSAITYAYLFDSPTYTDDTTDANSAGASDVSLYPATETTSDKFYFGCSVPFCGLRIDMGTAGVATGGGATSTLWEYYNGTTWATIEAGFSFVDDSVGFTAGTSSYFTTFVPPPLWAKVSVNSASAYWLRASVAVADYTTTPLATRIYTLRPTAGSGVRMPFAGHIGAVQMHATTASATNNDSVFLLINVTQGTWDTVTWTGADIMDRDTTVSLDVAAGDEVALMMLQEDGTTEFAGGSMILEVELR